MANNSVVAENGYVIDSVDPVVAITAPTKSSNAAITNTTIHITDNDDIFTGGVSVSPSSTVSYNNFNCTQTDSSTVDCTIEITGSGNLVINAEDGASNEATESENSYIVDMTNPVIAITAPDKLSNAAITTTTIHVTDNVGILLANVTIDPSSTAGVSGFNCSQTNATTVDCTINITSSGNLVIKAIDDLGNDITQAENNYIIDTAGPVIAITAPTKSSNAAIENTTIHVTDNNEVMAVNVSVDDTTTINDYDSFVCTQTNSKTVDCTIRLLSSGNLVIEALDLVSNYSHQAENGYTISIVAPVIAITAPTKASSTNITNTTIHVTDADGVLNTDVTIDPATTVSYSDFNCTQTDSDTVDCTIIITSSGNLKIKALDSLTNAGYQTESGYIIESVPPETTIDSSPALESTSSSASFSFSANESSTFRCKLDSGSYVVCTSPKSYSGLSNGSHTFYVYAIDLAGNSDATPASYTWTITVQQQQGGGGGWTPPDTTPPTNISILINNGENSVSSVNVSLTLAATGASTMMISNNALFTGSSWETFATTKTWALTSGNGTKTVYAKFKDASGNISTAVSDSITLMEVVKFEESEEPLIEEEPEEDIQPEIEPEEQTQSQTYTYELVSQSSYPSILNPGEETMVWVEVRNAGSAVWDNNVRLGTGSIYGNPNQQRDYNSEFANGDWLSPNRPTSIINSNSTAISSYLEPGKNAKFQFKIKAPSESGTYKAYFTPVADGITWMDDIGLYWEVTVLGTDQEVEEPVVEEPQQPEPEVQPQPGVNGDFYIVQPLDNLKSIAQKLYGDSNQWTRLVELNQDQFPTLVFNPNNIYSGWNLRFQGEVISDPQPEIIPEPIIETPIIETPEKIVGDYYIVQAGDSLKSIAGQVYGDSEQWTRLVELNKNEFPLLVFNPNNIYSGWSLRFQGEIIPELIMGPEVEIQPEPVVEPQPVVQLEPEPQLISAATPMVATGEFGYYEVQSGEDLQWIAQKLYGDQEKWRRLVELNQDQYPNLYLGGENVIYTGWLLKYDILTPLLSYDYEIVGQSVIPADLAPGEEVEVWLEVKNAGTATWYKAGDNPVRLGSGSSYGDVNQQKDYNSEFADGAWLSSNRAVAIDKDEVKPGETARFIFKIKAPSASGSYKAYFTPVVEGLEWMRDRGIYWEIKVKYIM